MPGPLGCFALPDEIDERGVAQASWSAAMNRPSKRPTGTGRSVRPRSPCCSLTSPRCCRSCSARRRSCPRRACGTRAVSRGDRRSRPTRSRLRSSRPGCRRPVARAVDMLPDDGVRLGLGDAPPPQPVQEPPEDPKGPGLACGSSGTAVPRSPSGPNGPLGPPSVPVDVEAEDVLDAEGTVVVEQSVDSGRSGLPVRSSCGLVRPDADEEARPLRRSGEPCGSQPTAAGAVGKWSAASVVPARLHRYRP